jgi:NADPH2:quinone reductase
VVAMPIHGAYAESLCLPQRELILVPSGLDAAEAVSLVVNYIAAYHDASFRQGQTGPTRGDSRRGGRGRYALLQLGHLAGLEMYGTCTPSRRSNA